MWTEVNFGKWKDKGKTLPQIIVADPDWFFWAFEQGAFKGALATQAATLARRARSIKLPTALAKTHVVQHWISHDGEYARFDLIEKSRFTSWLQPRSEPPDPQYGISARHPAVRQTGVQATDFKLQAPLVRGKAFAKAKVEAFFDDTANFDSP